MAVKLRKIRENMWEIKKEEKMKVPGLVFAFDVLMDRIKAIDYSKKSLINIRYLYQKYVNR